MLILTLQKCKGYNKVFCPKIVGFQSRHSLKLNIKVIAVTFLTARLDTIETINWSRRAESEGLKFSKPKGANVIISFKRFLFQCILINIKPSSFWFVCFIIYVLLLSFVETKQYKTMETEKVPRLYSGLEFPPPQSLLFLLLMVLDEQWRM